MPTDTERLDWLWWHTFGTGRVPEYEDEEFWTATWQFPGDGSGNDWPDDIRKAIDRAMKADNG